MDWTDPFPGPGAAPAEDVDVLIVGAGLSGVGAAVHLQQRCPGVRFLLLEARDAVGGTWDLFRYPGVRSDSDMHTLGYVFRPWTAPDALAGGAAIRAYIQATVRDHGLAPFIRHGHRAVRADWRSDDGRWSVEVDTAAGLRVFTCRVIDACSGYYRYDRGHRPTWPDEARFAGRIVHPQFWPDDLDTRGQRVAVIGSGATAVTLVPALAATAAHVTLVQRSPTYVMSLPARDRLASALRRVLPSTWAYRLVRAKNIALALAFFRLSRRFPGRVRRHLLQNVARQLPAGCDVERHFGPRYRPWDQRLCLVPDGDLFRALRSGRASVATGTIASFTETGLRLADGTAVAADTVVTATGLELALLGGLTLRVDGVAVDPAGRMAYKAMMLAGVPNLVLTFGYTNASWTLKADLTAQWLCRLLRHLDRRGARFAVPRADPSVAVRPFLDFTSGYVARAGGRLPVQGDRPPWRLDQNYLRDWLALRLGRIDDGTLAFDDRGAVGTAPATAPGPTG